MAKYWKTIITVEVLTEDDDPPNFNDLSDVAYEITDGHASGVFSQSSEEVTEEKMRGLLLEQGSDPDFLIIAEEEEEIA